MKESFSLSYAISKIGKNILVNEIIDYSSNNGVYSVNNEVSALNDMPTPQDKDKANKNTYMCPTPGIENTTISYNNNQPVESNVWDNKVYPIEFLDINSKNIYFTLIYGKLY